MIVQPREIQDALSLMSGQFEASAVTLANSGGHVTLECEDLSAVIEFAYCLARVRVHALGSLDRLLDLIGSTLTDLVDSMYVTNIDGQLAAHFPDVVATERVGAW